MYWLPIRSELFHPSECQSHLAESLRSSGTEGLIPMQIKETLKAVTQTDFLAGGHQNGFLFLQREGLAKFNLVSELNKDDSGEEPLADCNVSELRWILRQAPNRSFHSTSKLVTLWHLPLFMVAVVAHLNEKLQT
jgi:hypothetical protein